VRLIQASAPRPYSETADVPHANRFPSEFVALVRVSAVLLRFIGALSGRCYSGAHLEGPPIHARPLGERA